MRLIEKVGQISIKVSGHYKTYLVLQESGRVPVYYRSGAWVNIPARIRSRIEWSA